MRCDWPDCDCRVSCKAYHRPGVSKAKWVAFILISLLLWWGIYEGATWVLREIW